MGVSNGNSYSISIAAKLSANVKTDLQTQLNQIKGLEIDVDVKSDRLKSFIDSLAEIQKYKKLDLDFNTQESIASARDFGEKIGATAASSLKSNLEKALETTQIFSELQQNLEKSNTAIGRVVNSYATKIDQARTNLGYTSGIMGDLASNLRMLRKALAEFKKSNGLDDLRETLQNISPLAGSLRTMFDGEKGALKELNDEYSRHVTLVEAAVNAEKGKGDTAQKLPEALKAEAEAIAQANKAVASAVVNSPSSSSSPSPSAPRKEPGESDERYYLRLRKAQISEGNKQYKQELSGNTAKVNAYEKLNKYIDNEITSLNLTQEKKKELEKTLELDKKKSGLNRSLARLDNSANSRKDVESQYLALSRQKLKNSVNIARSSGDSSLKKIYESYDNELDKRIAALSPSRDIRRSVNKTLLQERTRTNAQLQQIQSSQASAQSAAYQKQYIDNYKKIIALKKQLDTLDSSEVEKKKVLTSEISKLNASNKELVGNGSVKRNDVSAQTKKIDNEYKSSKAIRNAGLVDSANNAKSAAYQKQYIDNYKKIIAKKKELLSVDSTETNRTKLLEAEIKRLGSANDKLINKYGVKKQSVSNVTKALDREYSEYLKLRNAQNADANVSNAQSSYLQKYEERQKNLLLASKNKNNSSLADIYRERAADLEKELEGLREGSEYSTYKDTDSFKNSQNEINHRYRQLSEIQGQQNARSANNQTIAYDKLSNRLTEYFNKYQAGISSSVPLTQKFNILLNKLNNREFDSIGEAQNEFARFRIACRDAGVEVDDFYSKLKRRVGTILKTSLIQGGLYKITNQAQQMLQSVIELDSAMTELRKVTTATEDEYSSFLINANTRARELGATLVETVSSTADFARLGYGIDDASTLSNAALVYSNVGDDIDSIDDATQSIISTMQAYGYEVDDVMSIVDKFNEVGNNFATSSGDIGEGLQRSAAALQAGGNTLDESIALFTAAQTTTQDADVVGTALKTVSMRLRSASTDEMDAEGLDTEGMADSTAKLRKELKALTGVDIMLDDSTFKSTYQILTEIAKVWDQMTDVSQASALELMFGKRQGSIGAAILQNVDIAEGAYETSLNSSGSAERENEVYLDSIQGRLDKLTASYQVLSSDVINSDLVKTVISGATTILDLLDSIASTIGSLPALAGAAALAFSSYTNDYIIGKTIDVADPTTGETSKKFVMRSQVSNYAYRDSNFAQLRTDTSGLAAFIEKLKEYANEGAQVANINEVIADTMSDVSDEARDAANGIFSSTFETADDDTSYFDIETAQSLAEAFSTDRTNSINAAFDNNFMREGSFLTDAGVEQIKKYNEAVQRGEEALTDFRSSMSDIDPVAAHMINNSNGAQISTDYLTSSVRNGSVANRLYARSLAYSASNAQNASLRARAASSAFSAAATVARTTSTVFDTLGISIKGIAGSLAFTAAITIAMKGLELLASKIDDIIHKAEKLREKAEESANVFKETSEKLSEYENELSSVQKKIEALDGKGELSLTDEEELERLKAENSELERKVKYYEILTEQGRRQATDDAVAALDEYTDDVGTKGTASYARYSSDREKYIQDGTYDIVDDLSYKLEQYKEAEQELKDLESDYINAPEGKRSSIESDVNDQEDRVAELKESLLDYYNEVNTLYSGITRGDSAEGDAYITKLSPILEEIINYLYEAEDAAESADTAIADVGKDTINETINNINGAAKGFESLNEIYDDIRDGSTTEGALFDFTSLVDEDFTSTFSNYTTEYDNFIKTVANSPNDLTKCQSAFNDLVTAWVDGSGALDNLDETNKNVAVQMLKNMGITNATAVVESKLTQARLKEATASARSLESSEARIEAFNNEIVAMGLTQTATEKLQVAFKNAETAKTELMRSGVLARLKLTKEEIESFQSFADVLNSVSSASSTYYNRNGNASDAVKNAGLLNNVYNSSKNNSYLKSLYSYGKYLDAIDATIAEVSSVNTTISSYKPADISSSSDAVELPEAYQRALAELKHQREMDEIDSEEYYEKLEALRKKYLDGVNIDEYIDENRSLLEEIYNGYKEVVDDYISKREEWISDRDTYQDWGPDDDAEKEWLRIIDKINDAAAKGLLSEKQKAELLEDAYRNAYEARLDLMSEHKDALQNVIDLTIDLYKQGNDDLKESLEDQRDIYKEIIDVKKEALELAEDELSYQESVEEKVKEISKLQNQYDVLSLDDSREAQAKRATISEEITDLQDELAQYQREHNVEATQTMLDEQYEKYEERIDDELDALDDALDDAYEMIRFSLNRIENDSDGLYNDLITWNRKYGSGIDSDVTNSWNVAIDAVKRYKDTVDGINSASDVYDYLNHETDDSFAQRGKNFGNSSDYNNSTSDGNIQEIADKVRANLGSGNKLRLVNKDWSSPSGTQDGDLVVTGGGIYLKTSGGGKKVAPLNTTTGTTTSYAEVKKIYEAICKSLSINGYSKGGVVPYTGLAMLHGSNSSAETVFSAAQSKKLYDLINANTAGSLLSNILKKSADSIGNIAKTVSYSSNPTISVSVDSPINITGATEKISEELDKYGEKLANKITQQITSAFSIRGKSIKASFNSL